MKYILEDTYEDGKPKYFKQMTSIGPMSTPDINEAEVFETEDDAKLSPANRHWSANWKVTKCNHRKENS